MRREFVVKFSQEQREAVVIRRNKTGETYPRIAELAAAGELGVEPFDISVEYIAQLCRTDSRRRNGKTRSKVAELPARDGVDILKRRLLALADSIIAAEERKPAKNVDLARIRDAARAVREAAAIPEPQEPAFAPGQHIPRSNGGKSRGGETGSLLIAHRSSAKDRPSSAHEPSRETRSNGSETRPVPKFGSRQSSETTAA